MSYSQTAALRASNAKKPCSVFLTAEHNGKGLCFPFWTADNWSQQKSQPDLILEVGRQRPAWAPGHGTGLKQGTKASIAGPGEQEGVPEANGSFNHRPPCTEMRGRSIPVCHPAETSVSARMGVRGWAAGVTSARGKTAPPREGSAAYAWVCSMCRRSGHGLATPVLSCALARETWN